MARVLAALLLVSFVVPGCIFRESYYQKIDSVVVLQKTPPYQGQVNVQLHPYAPQSPPIFEMRIVKNRYGGLPEQKFLEKIKLRGAELGANLMVFDCAPAGTQGQRICVARGYRI